jgi:hypothetical protein
MSTEGVIIAILTAVVAALVGALIGHLLTARREGAKEIADVRGALERLEGRTEASQEAAAPMQQQVNITLPAGSEVATPQTSKTLPSGEEILTTLKEIGERLEQLELGAGGPPPPMGFFHGYEFGGQFMSQLHWFARWYETFSIDVGLLLMEVVKADNQLRLDAALEGAPLGVLPSRAHAVDEALRKGTLELDVTSQGAALALTEKGRELLKAWRSWLPQPNE